MRQNEKILKNLLRIINSFAILYSLEDIMAKCIHEVSGITWGRTYSIQDMANGKVKIIDNQGSVVWIDVRCFDI